MQTVFFRVQGAGDFPADLLDASTWPRGGADRAKITERTDRRTVNLATQEPMSPDFDQWAAAGWAVVDVAR